jgi:hypothetical protein
MNRTELITELRRLADRVEASDLPEEIDANFHVYFHQVTLREQLVRLAKFLIKPTSQQSRGSYWLSEGTYNDDVQLSVHYAAGLLGQKRVVKVREVTKEKNSQAALDALLASEDPAGRQLAEASR